MNFDYCFLDICVGWFGKVYDVCVFKNFLLFVLCCVWIFFLFDMLVMIFGVWVFFFILGDLVYVFSEWLMKLYIDCGNLILDESKFNVKYSMIRVVVENVFGWLKGRFRSISKRLDLNVENFCNVIVVCCVLYNYCENLYEFFDD